MCVCVCVLLFQGLSNMADVWLMREIERSMERREMKRENLSTTATPVNSHRHHHNKQPSDDDHHHATARPESALDRSIP